MEIKANSKGQITIPLEICQQLGIKDGTYFQIEVDAVSKNIVLTPITREFIHNFRGTYKGKGLMKSWLAGKEN